MGISLRYADGLEFNQIRRTLQVSRPTIYKCLDKALAAGAGLKDVALQKRADPFLAYLERDDGLIWRRD